MDSSTDTTATEPAEVWAVPVGTLVRTVANQGLESAADGRLAVRVDVLDDRKMIRFFEKTCSASGDGHLYDGHPWTWYPGTATVVKTYTAADGVLPRIGDRVVGRSGGGDWVLGTVADLDVTGGERGESVYLDEGIGWVGVWAPYDADGVVCLTNAGAGDSAGEVQQASMAARLTHAQVGDRVRVATAVYADQRHLVGKVVEVTEVDTVDRVSTFQVKVSTGTTYWVHDVYRVEVPAEPAPAPPAEAGPLSVDERLATRAERVAHAKVGDHVRVVTVCGGSIDWVGKVGQVTRVDEQDSSMPFRVLLDEDGEQWVYDVAKVAATEAAGSPFRGAHPDLVITDERHEVPTEDGLDMVPGAEVAQRIRDAVAAAQATHREQMAAFRKKVGQVAMRYAHENDWCSVVRSALDEIGVDVPSDRRRIKVVVEYTIEADPAEYGADHDTGYVRASLTGIDDVGLDSDWENVEIVETSIDVRSVETIED